MIKDDGITPYLNSTVMVKYFKYACDSWVGYDNAETFAMKDPYTNDRCLVSSSLQTIRMVYANPYSPVEWHNYLVRRFRQRDWRRLWSCKRLQVSRNRGCYPNGPHYCAS